MIDEMLRVMGSNKKSTDVFDLRIDQDNDGVIDHVSDLEGEELPAELSAHGDDAWKELRRIYAEIEAGAIQKPDWVEKLEEEYAESCDFRPDTTLVITPKSEEFAPLAKLVSKFLYSTEHEATRDG
jgi:hypothetical protein